MIILRRIIYSLKYYKCVEEKTGLAQETFKHANQEKLWVIYCTVSNKTKGLLLSCNINCGLTSQASRTGFEDMDYNMQQDQFSFAKFWMAFDLFFKMSVCTTGAAFCNCWIACTS